MAWLHRVSLCSRRWCLQRAPSLVLLLTAATCAAVAVWHPAPAELRVPWPTTASASDRRLLQQLPGCLEGLLLDSLVCL